MAPTARAGRVHAVVASSPRPPPGDGERGGRGYHAPPVTAWRRYLRLFAPYRRAYALGLLLLLLTNALNLLVPWLVKRGVDALAGAPAASWPRGAGDVALALTGLAVVLFVVRTGSRVVILGIGRALARDLRDRLYARLLRADPAFLGRFPTGDLMSRSISDVQILQAVSAPGVLYAFNGLFMFALVLPPLLALDAELTLVMLAPFPALALGTAFAAARVRRYAAEAQEATADLTRVAQESLSGMEVVKAFTLERRQAARFLASNDVVLDRTMREAAARNAIGVAATLVGGLGTAAILWIGGGRVAEGRLSWGDLALFVTMLALVLRPTVFLGWVLSLAQRGLAALDRVDEVLDAPVGVAPPPTPTAPAAPAGGPGARVELRGLTVRYPLQGEGAARRPALEDVSVVVEPGRTLGLSGRIGSGKTTLLRAIPRLVLAPAGGALVDGVPVEAWDLAALRGLCGFVPQETGVFSATLRENVAFGRPEASDAEVAAAVAAAELTKDLDQLPRGLETWVGERGVTLSGGQRQRLAIARAVLVRPRVLLLDDALSMVDAETAVAVLGNLRRALPGATFLVAAHRTATLLGADEVLVLEEGRVVERGAPAALLTREGGRFHAAHERQRLQAEVEGP